MANTKQQIFKDYFKLFKKEALLKAFLCALAIGFGAIFITAFSCWFTGFNGFWLYPITFAVSFGAAMPLFYFYVFYPTKKYVAKRLDKLGLKERILTMVEFENQDSYIMKRQREDAMNALKELNAKLAKFSLAAFLIAVPVVTGATGGVMLSVDAANKAGLVRSGYELIGEMNRDKTTYELVYKIPEKMKEFGTLYSASNPDGEEEITLTVGKGQDGEAVMPVATKGYVFRGWSDGVGDVIRRDTSVQGKIVVSAIFEELDLTFENDAAEDQSDPLRLQKGSSFDNNGEPGNPTDVPMPDDPDPQPSGSKYEYADFVFDGQTYYGGAPYQDAYETSMGELLQSNADSDSKGIASDYMDAIGRG